MSTPSTQLEYRPLRAPRENLGSLCEPPLEEVGALIEENVYAGSQHQYDFQGRGLAELRRDARATLLRDAWQWTTSYRNAAPLPERPGKILLAGHQPGLFHPGVWMKNFGLDSLAREHRATAVNLLIDSDTVKQTWLRVPGGSVDDPQVELIAFDEPGDRVPYEDRGVHDPELFASAGRRTAEHIAPLVPDPTIREYWPLAEARRREVGRLGAALAQSRHQLEGRWGLETLEVPQSLVCQSEPFCWFVGYLLARLPRLWEIHNEVVREYRRVHGIRSASHPVPDLHSDGVWLEAPLWVWRSDDPRRRPVYVRQQADEILLSDGEQWQMALRLTADGDPTRAVERLMEASREGVRIRSRALITTLWARLILGDLFIHGIGGAKYDQLTDMLIQRFFGLAPPRFLVLSATLHLPVPHDAFDVEEERRIRHDLRQLDYHPERFLDPAAQHDPAVAQMVRQKRRWIDTPQTDANAKTRCHAIRRINRDLQPYVTKARTTLRKLHAAAKHSQHAAAVLNSRDYAACLFPKKSLLELARAVLHKSA